jgi:hypothetical protein
MLPLCCLNEGGCVVGWVIRELNGRFFDFTNCKHGEGPITFKAVHEMLGDASMLRLKVDAALAVPVLLKMICSRS